MREPPDHHDAELLLRLYDLRREARLRQAREWFLREFHPASDEEMVRRYPPGSEENAFYRMVVSYWDMAASIINNGLIKEHFFFENTTEFFLVWERLKPVVAGVRARRKNPFAWKNLETVAEKYEKWLGGRAPGAADAFRQQVVRGTVKKET